jgi:hypothetical protein
MANEPKTHRITITVSEEIFREIDRRAVDHRAVCRARFVLDALEAFLAGRTAISIWPPDPPPWRRPKSGGEGVK